MNLKTLVSIEEISAGDWDSLLPDAQPFMQHRFFSCLERSQSVGQKVGWQVAHKTLWAEGKLVAAMPCYLKSHSLGEYVFDMAWADACVRAGIGYYPKLLGAVPFSPIQGARLLGDASGLISYLTEEAKAVGLSGIHINFTDKKANATLQAHEGWLERLGCQFHWVNKGYRDFQDFLETFNSRKRKQVRKERASVLAQGFELRWHNACELTETDWDFVYACYVNTYHIRGRSPYLTRSFFSHLAQSMPEHVEVLMVVKEGKRCAMALSLVADGRLYGRYWGALIDAPNLHFEACFYQGIERAIDEGWQYFDAGAQGEHKLIRGFEPVITHSWHWLAHAGLRRAVETFLSEERVAVQQYAHDAREFLPYRVALTDA